jgi:hypothetical protein
VEPDGSLPHSQVPATCPYLEPARSSPRPHIPPRISILILSSYLRLGFSSGPFPQVSPPKPVHTSPLPIRATCTVHLNLLDLITRKLLLSTTKVQIIIFCIYLFIYLYTYSLQIITPCAILLTRRHATPRCHPTAAHHITSQHHNRPSCCSLLNSKPPRQHSTSLAVPLIATSQSLSHLTPAVPQALQHHILLLSDCLVASDTPISRHVPLCAKGWCHCVLWYGLLTQVATARNIMYSLCEVLTQDPPSEKSKDMQLCVQI